MCDQLPELDKTTIQEIMRLLHEQSRYYVAPIYWGINEYDAHSVLHNGSCFVVEIGDSRFAITAHHVIEQYLVDRRADARTHLQIRNLDIPDWDDRLIDSHPGLDIATFRISESESAGIEIRPFKCSAEHWPPTPPKVGRGVFFTGYAGVDRSVVDSKTLEFAQSSNGVVLTSLGPEELEVQIRIADLRQPYPGADIPPVTKDLGGFSGAPLLTVSASPHQLFRLGGIVLKQVPAKDENDVVTFISRRPNCIRPNGTLITSTQPQTE